MKQGRKIANRLSLDLAKFDSKYEGVFMCPTCLQTFPAQSSKKITDAHIIPKAADGKELTLLCRKCNSHFGANQDKWLGEWIDYTRDVRNDIFSTKTQARYIDINGQRVRAFVKSPTNESGIEVYIPENMNPPGLIDSMDISDRATLSIPIPLMKSNSQINVGYLTAGYLLWFKQIGYSWVFQTHLDKVREQSKRSFRVVIDKQELRQI